MFIRIGNNLVRPELIAAFRVQQFGEKDFLLYVDYVCEGGHSSGSFIANFETQHEVDNIISAVLSATKQEIKNV